MKLHKKPPLNAEGLKELLDLEIEPGYEFSFMDIVVELLEENHVDADIQNEVSDLFISFVGDNERFKPTSKARQVLEELHPKIASRYKRLRDTNHPGYCMLQAALHCEETSALLEYAADLGCGPAARIYAGQLLIEGNPVEAKFYLSKAISLGDTASYADYGNLIYAGETHDHQLSLSIYKKGIEAGNAECALQIVEHNLEKDYRRYVQIAESLHSHRWRSTLAWKIIKTQGPIQDAIAILNEAIRDGEDQALVKMGRIYLEGLEAEGVSIKADAEAALAYVEPFKSWMSEAAYVFGAAKLRLGTDIASAITKLHGIMIDDSGNPEVRCYASFELGNAYFGKYGEEAQQIAKSAVNPKDFVSAFPSDFNSLDPDWLKKECELIENLKPILEEYHDA